MLKMMEQTKKEFTLFKVQMTVPYNIYPNTREKKYMENGKRQ